MGKKVGRKPGKDATKVFAAIRSPRVMIDWTEREALILRQAGYPPSLISAYKLGKREITKPTAITLHVLTGRPLLELLYGDALIEKVIAKQIHQARTA